MKTMTVGALVLVALFVWACARGPEADPCGVEMSHAEKQKCLREKED